MVNIKSQVKRNRQNEAQRQRNRSVSSEIKTRTSSVLQAAQEGSEETPELLRLAVKRIDAAAAKGIIHPNAAARKKSRLSRRVSRILAGEE